MSMRFPTIKPVDNTKARLLKWLDETPLRVGTIVRHWYPQSKQPEKKAATFERHLRQLARRGLARECDGVWFSGRPATASSPSATAG